MVLRSAKFDDVYFSADDGLEETHHVFINGNNLAKAWQGIQDFYVAETGFGTGLNFLATWKHFEETAPNHHKLNFISVEKYPLSKQDIKDALQPWSEELGRYIYRYLDLYPIRVPGPHKLYLTERVTLTVWFGDIEKVLPEWQGFQVDAWFLDGFTPAKNPDMWTDFLYQSMARLSHSHTTLASFTAAGHVRRGLEAVGFVIEKAKGFGRKRDMITGRYEIGHTKVIMQKPTSMAIIGGGLAGCAMAYIAARAGVRPVIYEAGDTLAVGASGGKLGMINPRLTAKPTPQSDYYTAAYAHALRVLHDIEDVEFNRCGSLHKCLDDDKDRRFIGYIDNLGWHGDHILRKGNDLYYPDGAVVSPEKLCRQLAEAADLYLNHKVENLSDIKEDIIILANGYAVTNLLADDLPIHSVRGQVSWVRGQKDIDHNICFGGYITPPCAEGFHVLGSSFQPWDQTTDIKQSDHQDNLKRFNNSLGRVLTEDDVVGGWAALRTSSKDRFPVIGHIQDNIYISTAHGSHGIISSLLAADIIVSQLCGNDVPVSRSVLSALFPKRFDKSSAFFQP